jgi:hypothetical protein
MDAISGNKAKDYTQGELSGALKDLGGWSMKAANNPAFVGDEWIGWHRCKHDQGCWALLVEAEPW